ncbi:MAG: DUF169 domain-containing protein, partial [Desulfobacteraceae bacterium]
MESKIAEAIGFKYHPVAIILTDTKPEKARQFKEGKWGCVMFLLAAAAKGETAVFDRKTFGCQGGGVGLGFGNQYKNFPGGEKCFCYFLSTGNQQWEQGRQTAEQVKPFLRPEAYENFVHGERYVKSPELVKKFIECLPITDIPFEYFVFKPLKDTNPDREKPEVVVFLGDMDQISALTIMANYAREDNENVILPHAAGCQSIGIYALKEANSEKPRAVLGLNDISARLAIKRLLKDDVMSFAVPYALFQEMEENVPGSFL